MSSRVANGAGDPRGTSREPKTTCLETLSFVAAGPIFELPSTFHVVVVIAASPRIHERILFVPWHPLQTTSPFYRQPASHSVSQQISNNQSNKQTPPCRKLSFVSLELALRPRGSSKCASRIPSLRLASSRETPTRTRSRLWWPRYVRKATRPCHVAICHRSDALCCYLFRELKLSRQT